MVAYLQAINNNNAMMYSGEITDKWILKNEWLAKKLFLIAHLGSKWHK